MYLEHIWHASRPKSTFSQTCGPLLGLALLLISSSPQEVEFQLNAESGGGVRAHAGLLEGFILLLFHP